MSKHAPKYSKRRATRDGRFSFRQIYQFKTFTKGRSSCIQQLGCPYVVEMQGVSESELIEIFRGFTPLYMQLSSSLQDYFEHSIMLFFIFCEQNDEKLDDFDWSGRTLPDWRKPLMAVEPGNGSDTIH
jgi:hypothetical protein